MPVYVWLFVADFGELNVRLSRPERLVSVAVFVMLTAREKVRVAERGDRLRVKSSEMFAEKLCENVAVFIPGVSVRDM